MWTRPRLAAGHRQEPARPSLSSPVTCSAPPGPVPWRPRPAGAVAVPVPLPVPLPSLTRGRNGAARPAPRHVAARHDRARRHEKQPPWRGWRPSLSDPWRRLPRAGAGPGRSLRQRRCPRSLRSRSPPRDPTLPQALPNSPACRQSGPAREDALPGAGSCHPHGASASPCPSGAVRSAGHSAREQRTHTHTPQQPRWLSYFLFKIYMKVRKVRGGTVQVPQCLPCK